MKLNSAIKSFIRAYVIARKSLGYFVDASDEYSICKILNLMTYEEREAVENYLKSII